MSEVEKKAAEESEEEKEETKQETPAKKTEEKKESPVAEKDLYDTVAERIGILKSKAAKEYYRTKPDHQYATLEDFARMVPEQKRVVVIGCTGAGKSTLLNKMAGNRFTLNDEYVGHWRDDPPLFESNDGVESVTKLTSFANIHWLGDKSRMITVVDTPGHDDSAGSDVSQQEARDKLGEIAADLHNKLKAMGRVDAILIVHNDPISNRLNPATYTILQMVDEKFKKAEANVWECVAIAYSKCDAESKQWRQRMDPWAKDKKSKQQEMRDTIKTKFENCKVDVPVFTLSGWHEAHDEHGNAEFERLWKFFEECKGVETTHLQPFEGIDRKWEKLIQEKDAQQALLDAMEAQNTVVFAFFALLLFVLWRAVFVPRLLSIFVLDLPGPIDDLLLFIGLAQFIGFTKVQLSLKLFYDKWLRERVEGALEKVGLMKPKEKEE